MTYYVENCWEDSKKRQRKNCLLCQRRTGLQLQLNIWQIHQFLASKRTERRRKDKRQYTKTLDCWFTRDCLVAQLLMPIPLNYYTTSIYILYIYVHIMCIYIHIYIHIYTYIYYIHIYTYIYIYIYIYILYTYIYIYIYIYIYTWFKMV